MKTNIVILVGKSGFSYIDFPAELIADQLGQIRDQLRQLTLRDEQLCVEQLLQSSGLCSSIRDQILSHSRALVEQCRDDKSTRAVMDDFLQEFGLSNKEGVALMCLAEALLRVPDAKTADRLIAEKISDGNWQLRLRKSSDSLFVNTPSLELLFMCKSVDKFNIN